MAYGFHIERLPVSKDGAPTTIALDEWKAAVSAIEGVRLCPPGTATSTNPRTGEVISIPRQDGDLEVYFADERIWRPAFRWSGGAAHVKAGLAPGDSSHPVWVVAVTLASRLGAVIRGDEGEVYDLRTGDIVEI